MRYLLSKDFVKIEETSGTVQNANNGVRLEVSQSPEPDTGILIYPLQKHTFKDTQLYLRCVDGYAEARVVPFEFDNEGGGGDVEGFVIAGESYYIASNVEIYNLLDDIFGEE